MRLNFVFLLNLFLLGDGQKRRLKILINSPAFGYSHLKFNGRLADLLVDAGHEVHVYIPNWEINEKRNGTAKAHRVVRFIAKNVDYNLEDNPQLKNPFLPEDPSASAKVWENFKKLTIQHCKDQLNDPEYTKSIQNGKFDVAISYANSNFTNLNIFSEMHDSCAFFHFYKAGIKTIIMSAAMVAPDIISLSWNLPLPRSYVAPWLLPSINTPKLTYSERLLNILLDTVVFSQLVEHQNLISHEFTKHYGEKIPTYPEVLKRVKYVFINMPEMLDHPRPISYKFKSVGGIHLKPATPMSPQLASIFNKSKRGVVLFSYGSNIDMEKMPRKMKEIVVETFSKFPDYSFIWRIKPSNETKALLEGHHNIYAIEWVTQLSILSDKRTKLFITHCGLNSIIETAWHGVPALVQPFFNDQYLNAALLLNRKTALHVDKHKMTVDSFSGALQKLLTDPSFKINAETLSQKLRNNPVNVSEMFVKHVEYAASFDDNFEMNIPDLDTITYYNLDIYLPFAVILLLLIYVVYCILKGLFKLAVWALSKKQKLE